MGIDTVVRRSRGAAVPTSIVAAVAGVVSAMTALEEVTVSAGACSAGRSSLGDLGLWFMQVLALVAVQTTALTMAYRLIVGQVAHRALAAGSVAVVGVLLIAVIGWGYLALTGLPVSCGATHPFWWPRWLPPGVRVAGFRPAE